MLSKKIVLFLCLLLCGAFSASEAFAQYSAPKIKIGMNDANVANANAEPKSLLSRSDCLINGEQEGLLRKDVSAEWRLGYSFQSWFIMMVQYRSLKDKLTPDEAEACTNLITTFGQKFRREQKTLGISDEKMFEALGKSSNIPEMYAAYWPAPSEK